jgi:hypothetical protein
MIPEISKLYDKFQTFGFNLMPDFFRESLVAKNGKRRLQRGNLKGAEFIKFTAVDQHIDTLAVPEQFRN